MVPQPARMLTLAVAVLGLALGLGCTSVTDWLVPAPRPEDLAVARQLLDDGHLPEAMASYRDLNQAFPGSVEAATGLSYTLLLAGRLGEADVVLAGVRQSSEVALRRAELARRRDLLDEVRTHGLASGTPAGQVLAAEVMIVDLDLARAIEVLATVAETDGTAAATARRYLGLLQHEEPQVRALANPVALWALGKRREACEGADRFLRKLDADAARSELLLLWAGRAVTSGLPRVARGMVEEAVNLPRELQWRARATLAMVEIAEGDPESGLRTFDALRSRGSGVPVDGLDDARVTACGLARDAGVAERLVEGLDSPAAASCLVRIGAIEAARDRVATGGALGRMLEKL